MNKNIMKEICLWTGIIIITAVAFISNYLLEISAPVKAIVWIIWLLAFCGISYFTSKGQQVFDFGVAAKTELFKVVWPTRQETIQTTTIVMIMVAVTGFILWMIDSGMMWIIAKITHLG